jgi:hypothetical protein
LKVSLNLRGLNCVNKGALQAALFPNGTTYSQETGDFESIRTPDSANVYNYLAAVVGSVNGEK